MTVELYPDAEYTVADQLQMRSARNYLNWQVRIIAPHLGRRVLEVGCGVGNLTSRLLDREYVLATDCEPHCLEALRRQHGHASNLEVACVSVSDLKFLELRERRVDSILCVNVLEHIADDVQALCHMSQVVSCRGRIVLIVPAFPMLYGPIDERLGHFRRYTKDSLRIVAEKAALEVSTLRYMNMAGFFGWWVNGRVRHLKAQSALQIALFDRWLVPAVSRLEDVVPPPLGQSLLAVFSVRAAVGSHKEREEQ